jgi:hypothetical protein
VNTDSIYLVVLAWSFVITNAARLFAYLPTISKLARPGCTADGQSQLTWALWTVSNATFTLHLFEQLQRQVDATVLLCLGNVMMNLIIFLMVRRAQCRATRGVGARSKPAVRAAPHGDATEVAR